MNPLQPEIHPLAPFLPPNARLLLLGSFPPPRKRWSMDFFYPNYTNDMWRIFGLIFFDDKDHFVDIEKKKFRKDNIEQFLREKAIAVSDTVAVANRLNGNASDLTLEVVEPLNLAGILDQIPRCHTLVTTGQRQPTHYFLSQVHQLLRSEGSSIFFTIIAASGFTVCPPLPALIPSL